MSSQKQIFSSNLLYIMHKKSITRNQLSDGTGIPYTTIDNTDSSLKARQINI